jgi:hypothetical protein
MMAAYAISTMKHEGRSALPDAPVVVERRGGDARRRLAHLQGWLASVLHQVAWAIEPDLPAVTEPRQ